MVVGFVLEISLWVYILLISLSYLLQLYCLLPMSLIFALVKELYFLGILYHLVSMCKCSLFILLLIWVQRINWFRCISGMFQWFILRRFLHGACYCLFRGGWISLQLRNLLVFSHISSFTVFCFNPENIYFYIFLRRAI